MADLKVTDRRWWARGDAAPAPDAEVPRLKPTYIEELEARLAAKDAELQDLLSRYRAASDEFWNGSPGRARLRTILGTICGIAAGASFAAKMAKGAKK